MPLGRYSFGQIAVEGNEIRTDVLVSPGGATAAAVDRINELLRSDAGGWVAPNLARRDGLLTARRVEGLAGSRRYSL